MAGKICPVCNKSQTKKFTNRCEFCGQNFLKVATPASPKDLVKQQHSSTIANPGKISFGQEQTIASIQGLSELELSEKERLFGEISIELGFITAEDVSQATKDQKVDEAIGEKTYCGLFIRTQKNNKRANCTGFKHSGPA